MRKLQPETVRDLVASRVTDAVPLKRLPGRRTSTTQQMHRRLVRALSDTRIKRARS